MQGQNQTLYASKALKSGRCVASRLRIGCPLAGENAVRGLGLEACGQDVNNAGEDLGTAEVLAFPQALQRMLNVSGYRVET